MKPRYTVLPAPAETSARHWTVDLADKGAHLFRTPYYGVGSEILDWINTHHVDPETDTRTLQQKTAQLLPLFGAVFGACWHHREMEIEAVLPSKLTADALGAYGLAVIAEMEDADYTLPELFDLWSAVKPEFDRRISAVYVLGAAKRDFSSPPRAASTSN